MGEVDTMQKDQLPVTEAVRLGARRRFSEAERRRIVEETFAPGASVSVVARRHDVNANLVFKWRQRYGRDTEADTGFLPVAVQEPTAAEISQDIPPPTPKRRRARKPAESSFIEIELAGGHRVRVHGNADSRTVRSVIEALS